MPENCVTRTMFYWVVGGLVAIAGFGTMFGYGIYASGQDRRMEKIRSEFCSKDHHHEMELDVTRLQGDVNHIKESVQKLEETSKETLRILQRIDRNNNYRPDR